MIREKDFVFEVTRLCNLERAESIDVIGLALLNLGVEDNNFEANLKTKDILSNFFSFSDNICYWADKIQYYQDNEYSWKESILKADKDLMLIVFNEE